MISSRLLTLNYLTLKMDIDGLFVSSDVRVKFLALLVCYLHFTTIVPKALVNEDKELTKSNGEQPDLSKIHLHLTKEG